MNLVRLSFPVLTAALLAALGSIPAAAADRERSSDRGGRRNSGGTTSAAPSSAATAGAPVSPSSGFEAFQLIAERNIFNPNRIGRTRSNSDEKPPRVDEIALVGTMQSDAGVMAFFDSPDAAFKKTLKAGESVADFKVESIAPDGVQLMRGDKPLALKVAQQLRRAEGGDWNVITMVPEVEAVKPVEINAAAEPSADTSEALKRLMEKRKKQLQK